jgi:hypothetical protein
MKKSRLMLGTLATAGIVILIGAVAYVSLLGENNKIDELTQSFFQDLRSGNYDHLVGTDMAGPHEDPSDSLFLLDLALFKHYGLLGSGNCETVFRRSRLWVPYLSEGPVTVDVLVRKRPGKKFSEQALSLMGRIGSSGEKAEFVKNLLTVDRKGGNWVLASVNVKGSALEKTYADLQNRLRLQHDLTRTAHGFTMQAIEVNLDDMSFADKQVLLHMLRKAQEWLGGPVGAPKADGGSPFPRWLKGR